MYPLCRLGSHREAVAGALLFPCRMQACTVHQGWLRGEHLLATKTTTNDSFPFCHLSAPTAGQAIHFSTAERAASSRRAVCLCPAVRKQKTCRRGPHHGRRGPAHGPVQARLPSSSFRHREQGVEEPASPWVPSHSHSSGGEQGCGSSPVKGPALGLPG